MTVAETKPLGQLLLRPPRYGINAAAVPQTPGVPTYIRITDIDDSGRFAPDPKVGVDHPKSSDYRMSTGELVFARTGASVGKSYLYDPRDGEMVYAGFLINIAPDRTRLNPKYLSLFAHSKDYWDWITRTSVRSGQPGVNGQEYAQLPVPVPDIQTQNAIADVMSDVDDLIATLERLIAKKQAIKQGMMQQLLTGRTRLPGFGKSWRDLRLADLATLAKGTQLGRAAMKPGQSIPVWNGGTGPSGFTSRPNVNRPVVTVSEGGNSCGWVGRPNSAFWLGGHCYSLDPKPNGHSVAFLYHRLKLAEPQLMDLRVGSGLPNIQKKRLSDFLVSVPSDAAEAAAISQALDDADHEVVALQKRLIKARAIKQGMMQQLLTGRTRLPVETAS